MRVEPVPGAPAATVEGESRTLVVADYHAGVEASLAREGVEVASRAAERRERLLSLVGETGAGRVVFLGDLADAVGRSGGTERDELATLAGALRERGVAGTVVKGNHDGEIESIEGFGASGIDVTDAAGVRVGGVGFTHGHTWPAPAVLAAEVVCVGHEHPTVRIEDEVGGRRVERAWLRGPLAAEPFDADVTPAGELVVFPAFNNLAGGTWVNVPGQAFLAPFLPAALPEGDAYLLDGTNLGPYRSV
jgi:putative SbcD/Mre11-related phosphoesterase